MFSMLYKIYYDKWWFKDRYQLKELFLYIVNHSVYKDTKNDLKCLLDYIVVDKRLSKGFKEGLHNKIKMIRRMGLDIKNMTFLLREKLKYQ